VLPQEAVLTVRGRVVELVNHQGAVAMRVCFAPLDPQARGAIVRWIATQQRPNP
jgi:hypothetical protein